MVQVPQGGTQYNFRKNDLAPAFLQDYRRGVNGYVSVFSPHGFKTSVQKLMAKIMPIAIRSGTGTGRENYCRSFDQRTVPFGSVVR